MKKLLPIAILMFVGIICRIIPHPANFTPITAIAIFGGLYLPKKWALLLPFLTMIISDLFIGFYSRPIMLAVYLSFAAAIAAGYILRKYKKIPHILAGTLASSSVFFLTTNLAVWIFGTMYAKTFAGLASCFYMALPFFRNSLLGDIFYTGMLITAMELSLLAVKKFSSASINQP